MSTAQRLLPLLFLALDGGCACLLYSVCDFGSSDTDGDEEQPWDPCAAIVEGLHDDGAWLDHALVATVVEHDSVLPLVTGGPSGLLGIDGSAVWSGAVALEDELSYGWHWAPDPPFPGDPVVIDPQAISPSADLDTDAVWGLEVTVPLNGPLLEGLGEVRVVPWVMADQSQEAYLLCSNNCADYADYVVVGEAGVYAGLVTYGVEDLGPSLRWFFEGWPRVFGRATAAIGPLAGPGGSTWDYVSRDGVGFQPAAGYCVLAPIASDDTGLF